jgi:glycosyltransferase involved in cell wall biosynthesis
VRFIGPAALLARRRYRLPVPVVTHHHHLDPSPLNPFIEKRVLDASDRVITDSEFARRQLADELGLRTDHVTVVYCGVGPKYAPMPKDHTLLARYGPEGRQVLLCLGPLIHRKNPFFLVDAFAEIRRAAPGPVALVWVGAGPLRAELTALARKLGLERDVIFTGYVPEASPDPQSGRRLRPFRLCSRAFRWRRGGDVVRQAGRRPLRVASLGEMVDDGRLVSSWPGTIGARSSNAC